MKFVGEFYIDWVNGSSCLFESAMLSVLMIDYGFINWFDNSGCLKLKDTYQSFIKNTQYLIVLNSKMQFRLLN